jgi:hypothetical protein
MIFMNNIVLRRKRVESDERDAGFLFFNVNRPNRAVEDLCLGIKEKLVLEINKPSEEKSGRKLNKGTRVRNQLLHSFCMTQIRADQNTTESLFIVCPQISGKGIDLLWK